MNIVSPLFSGIGLVIALIWGYLGVKITRPSSSAGRFETLDGLRGYLAIFVMFHHSAIWFHYIKENSWGIINSNLYTHFGGVSVGLFFMITAFLFFSKIMDAKDKPIDWLRLFISRFMRIMPLYLLVFGALLLVVAILSSFKLQEDGLSLFRNIMA